MANDAELNGVTYANSDELINALNENELIETELNA